MLSDAIEFLACPVCGEELSLSGAAVACPNHHAFDVARQGYLNLLTGSSAPGTADTAAMVQARAEFLTRGHFGTLSASVADVVARSVASVEGCILDVGAGTGYYLAAVLDRLPERTGIALDISKHAAKRAAAAHPMIGAVVADTWKGLPMRVGSAAAVLDIFAPRNISEFLRVLSPRGVFVLVTPTERHLAELVASGALLTVDERKEDRLAEMTRGLFDLADRLVVEYSLRLSEREAQAIAAMGPSAHHGERREKAQGLPLRWPATVTVSAVVSTYRPRH